jgi:hypothetical protein
MCDKCNSGNKSTYDPIEYVKGRKLAFYPYAQNHPEIQFEFNLISPKIEKKITPAHYKLTVVCLTHLEELESWKRVFKIETKHKANGDIEYYGRYDELVCKKYEAYEWYAEIYEYFENAKSLSDIQKAEDYYYKKVIRSTTRNPRLVKNTIKRKFLEECKKKGLLNKLL